MWSLFNHTSVLLLLSLEKCLYYYTCLLLPSSIFLHHKNQFTKPWFIWKKGSRTLESPLCFMKISRVDISFSLKFQRGDNFLAQNSLLRLVHECYASLTILQLYKQLVDNQQLL